MAATIEELKCLLIRALYEKAMATIPQGNCPNCYYPVTYLTGCMSGDPNDNCTKCRERFKEALIKQIEKEVMSL